MLHFKESWAELPACIQRKKKKKKTELSLSLSLSLSLIDQAKREMSTEASSSEIILEEWNGSSSTKLSRTATITASPSLRIQRFFSLLKRLFFSDFLCFIFLKKNPQVWWQIHPCLETASPSICTRGKLFFFFNFL
jgi:hypothetical protein